MPQIQFTEYFLDSKWYPQQRLFTFLLSELLCSLSLCSASSYLRTEDSFLLSCLPSKIYLTIAREKHKKKKPLLVKQTN